MSERQTDRLTERESARERVIERYRARASEREKCMIHTYCRTHMQSYRAEIANGHLVEDFIQHALDLSHAYIHIHIQTYRHTDILIMSLSRQTMRMCMNLQ